MPRDEVEEPEGKLEKEPTILQRAIKYCWGDGFLSVFRAYFRKHASQFEVMAEGKTDEHDLVYQELFNEYLALFEGTLEDFLEGEGSTPQEFYEEMNNSRESPDPQVQLFIECLLASCDYDSFFKVMKREAAKQLAEKRQLAAEADAQEEEQEEEYPRKRK